MKLDPNDEDAVSDATLREDTRMDSRLESIFLDLRVLAFELFANLVPRPILDILCEIDCLLFLYRQHVPESLDVQWSSLVVTLNRRPDSKIVIEMQVGEILTRVESV